MRLYKFTQRTFEKWYARHIQGFEVHIYKAGKYPFCENKRFQIKKVRTIKFSPGVEQKMKRLETMLRRISYYSVRAVQTSSDFHSSNQNNN